MSVSAKQKSITTQNIEPAGFSRFNHIYWEKSFTGNLIFCDEHDFVLTLYL